MVLGLDPFALFLATLLSLHGYRKGSLSTSGAITAFLVGYLSLGIHVKVFGITLLAFYFVGSRATKIGHQIKATLETEHYSTSNPSKENVRKLKSSEQQHKSAAGGQRDAWQVLCNSAVSVTGAVLFSILYGNQAIWQKGKSWCLFDGAPQNVTRSSIKDLQSFSGSGISLQHVIGRDTARILFLVMLGHFACCMGDTLASELGILAKRRPRLIVPPFRIVPPGTNGALSVQGTLGSLVGGAFIGLIAGAMAVFYDNPACTSIAPTLIVAKTTALGALGGLGGSAIDSLLGATLQRTWYESKRKQILIGRLPPSGGGGDGNNWHVVTGYDVLSNNSVNFISSAATAALIAYVGNELF